MDVSSVASSAAVPATPAPAAKASDQSSAPYATAATSDSVTLSAAAQQILATTTASDTASASTAPLTWASDAVTQALTALNDSSGKTALSDQISAYKTLAAMVADASNFDPTKTANAKAVDVATAFSTSAFVQHYDELAAQFGALNHDQNTDHFGTDLSEMQQRQLNYVNSLSADDQQTLMQTYDASLAVMGSNPAFGSLAQYQATKQAAIDVSRAVEALVASPPYADAVAAHRSDNAEVQTAITGALRQKAEETGDTQTLDLLALTRGGSNYAATVKAYFDKYGPPPAQSEAQKAVAALPPPSAYPAPSAGAVRGFFTDIATLADTSGKASATTLVDAYKAVWSKASTATLNTTGDIYWMMGWTAAMKATGTKQIQQADTAWNDAGWAGRGVSHVSDAQSYYKAFDKLSDFDQQLVGALQGSAWSTTHSNATPDDFRAVMVDQISNAAQSDAIDALYQAENFGHLTAKSTVTILGVTLNLNQIMASNDKHLDPYTRMSADVKALLKDAAQRWAAGEKVSIDATNLNGAAPPTDAEKALAALKAYAAGTAPQSDDDKALAKLKEAAAAGDTAAVTLLKKAAEAQAKADTDKKDADKADAEHKADADQKQNTAATGDKTENANLLVQNTTASTGYGLSVQA